jgi:aspartyl-tRNA(Asn)/glutamyl-tRNA(Gln) amidotransferase subunit A
MPAHLTGSTIAALAAELASGVVTSRELTDAALASVQADGSAFTRVYADAARAAAIASDDTRKRGVIPSLLAGIPVSVKDLFDVAGEPTPAGSTILRDAPPAGADAPVIARLRAAGAIIIGRTHMSEFAFSGLGTNPHLPVLANPRDASRVPGGSSSGATASVARGQAIVGLGTDTGGSVRIPASYCGLTGFKPTQRRITRTGAFPLSESLDSIGPIANSVACCATVDAVLADEPRESLAAIPISGLRLGVPQEYVLDDLDSVVGSAFERALTKLGEAGARVEPMSFPELQRIPEIYARGTIANFEAYGIHSRLGLLRERHRYDPNVVARVETGARLTDGDYGQLLEARARIIRDADLRTAGYDALLFPATASVAPRFSDVVSPEGWTRANALSLRNGMVVNLLDRCALSVPMHVDGELPSGLMVVGETMSDARLLAIGGTVETALASAPGSGRPRSP